MTLTSIGDAVIATDFDTKITFINRVAQELTGWSESEALGKPIAKIFQIVNEATGAGVDSPVEKAIRTGSVVGRTCQSHRANYEGRRENSDR